MSSFINKITTAFKGLLVQNKNNYLEINESGRYNSSLFNIENFSKNKIVNISTLDNEVISKSGNIVLQSESGELKFKSGKGNDLLFDLLNPDYDSSTDSFFSSSDSTKINNIFDDNESVNALRDNSLLIESLDTKSICLYSNNGISQVSHGNMNLIGDNEILVQGSNKINLTSLGYLIFNSERMISNVEEDIIMLSGSGEIKLGGNGVTTTGIKINNNTDKNYLSIGNTDEKANRNLHIDINEASFDNTKKNGLVIESKDINNNNILPEIELNNYDKSVSINQEKLQSINLGIGSDSNDNNNLIFVSKENVSRNTYIKPLNSSFQFNQNDINKTITYTDSTISSDTIISVDNVNNRAQVNVNLTTSEINTFNSTLKQAHINRDDFGYIKTKTDSDLILGSNNNNIVNINNSGNIGINNLEPLSTLDIKNNYGLEINIRNNNNKKYYNPKVIQFNNSNYLVTFVTEETTFNIEGFIYNTNNKLVKSFTILENTTICPQFNMDNLKGASDRFVILYSYWNGTNVILKSNVFTNLGIDTGLGITKTQDNLTSIYEPSVSSFEFNNSGIIIYGYVIGFIDQVPSGNRHIYFELFLNESSAVISSLNYIQLLDSFIEQDNIGDSISLREFNTLKLGSLNTINGRQRIPIAFTGKITLNTRVKYYILFNTLAISFNTTKNTLELLENSTHISGEDILKLSEGINTDYNFNTLGFDILTLKDETIISYYLKEFNGSVIKSVYYEVLDNSNYTLGTPVKLDNSNIPVTDDKYLNFQFPSISLYETDLLSDKYFISYIILKDSNKQIKYFNSSTSSSLEISNTQGTQPFIKRLINSDMTYLTTVLFYNYDSISNVYNNDSIILKEIDTDSNFINFTNQNNDIKIKNSGEIDLNKQNVRGFVLSGFNAVPTSETIGVEGEMNYFGSNLYIYLGGNWNKVTLASI